MKKPLVLYSFFLMAITLTFHRGIIGAENSSPDEAGGHGYGICYDTYEVSSPSGARLTIGSKKGMECASNEDFDRNGFNDLLLWERADQTKMRNCVLVFLDQNKVLKYQNLGDGEYPKIEREFSQITIEREKSSDKYSYDEEARQMALFRQQKRAPQENRIYSSIFIGQVYVSSGVYLIGVHKENTAVEWPKQLIMRASNRNDKFKDKNINFKEEINGAPQEPSEEQTSYDPGLRLDGFFETVFDMTIIDSPIGHYMSAEQETKSYPVVAFNPALKLDALNFNDAGKKRPLTSEESKKVKEDRAAATKNEKENECTTGPSYLDEANQLWKAKLVDQDLTVRLSFYSDPGCAGHLVYIYVLDVLKDNQVQSTAEITHYFGAI